MIKSESLKSDKSPKFRLWKILFDKVWKPLKTSVGGVKRDRTADLLNAIQALSQLSYNPKVDFDILSFYGLQYFEIRFSKIKF